MNEQKRAARLELEAEMLTALHVRVSEATPADCPERDAHIERVAGVAAHYQRLAAQRAKALELKI